jgi:hypothetical protein
MSRTSARGQKLPPQEVELINSITADALIVRVKDLYAAGWPLQSIGDALSPPRPRTTIRSWVQKDVQPVTIDAPIPLPKKTEEGSPRPKKVSAGMSSATFEDIRILAPLARTYRSKMASTAAPAVANERLTNICKDLYEKNVPIKDLAAAAGVTYRAMYKRIKL